MEEIELHIDSLAAGGDGVGRGPDGRVVFVPGTAPGDRVRVRIERARARFARGRVDALLEPAPTRVEPPCPAFGRCGGCAWQHLDYPAQLEAKRRILSDALVRIGGISLAEPPPLTPSPEPYGYRLRTRLQVEGGRVGYRRKGSRELCAVESCPVLVPGLEAGLRQLAARAPANDGEWELACVSGEVRVSELGVGGRAGAPLELAVAGERVRFSAGVFAQANALLLESLVGSVLGALGSGGLLVELFAGSGLFTLPAARRFASVVAVEGDPTAAEDLGANLAAAGLTHVRVVRRRVEEAGSELRGLSPEALLLDPPRVGLAPGGAELLASLGAARVAYLSCDPATLARDLKALAPHGYRLVGVEGFDLFPQTPHVEALALLERS